MCFSISPLFTSDQAAEILTVTKPILGQGNLGSIKVFNQLKTQHLLKRS